MALSNPNYFKIADIICDGIANLNKSYELLEKVHLEIGPYGDGKLFDKTRYEINDYFEFDDSK